MTPAAIIQGAATDGVRLALSNNGTIRATGNDAAVNRWLATIRKQKTAIIDELKTASITAEEQKAIQAWLAHIEETDPETITEVLNKCRDDTDARQYFSQRAKEVPDTAVPDKQITCGECSHFERIDHPHLGHCAKGEPEAIAGLWDTNQRYCERYTARPDISSGIQLSTKKANTKS